MTNYKCDPNCKSEACWNACEESLYESIKRCKFVNEIRKELKEKRQHERKFQL